MKQKIQFITYGDSKKYSISKKHLINLAKHSNFFDTYRTFSKNDLDDKFQNTFKNILHRKRGGGYYIWKINIIQKCLEDLNNNDILVYCDAGSSLNFKAKNRFYEYIDLINDSEYGNLRFESRKIHTEKYWTSKEIFQYFKLDNNSAIGNSTQLLGGHLMFQNNNHTKEFFNIFINLLKTDPLLVTDFYKKNQIEGFEENRHDQSIMSIITKKYGGVILENETYFEKNSQDQFQYPFLSVRHYGHGPKDRVKYTLGYKRNTPIYF